MKHLVAAGILFLTLASPGALLAQRETQQYVPLDSFPVPINPGEISELTDHGLVRVWVPISEQSVEVMEPEEGSETRAVQFWVFIDEAGDLTQFRSGSDDNDPDLAEVVEAALAKLKYRPGLHDEKPVGAWAHLEFVFQVESRGF